MIANPTESWLNSFLSVGKVVAAEQNKRFERVSEVFTWLALALALFSVQVPFGQTMDKKIVYPFVVGGAVFCIVWFRLFPRRFSGLPKNFIFSLLANFSVALLIHTSGSGEISRYLVVLYYVITVGAVVSMPTVAALMIASAALILILAEWVSSGAPSAALSSTILYSLGLLIVVFYTRSLAGEAALSRQKEEEENLEKERTLSKLKDEYVFIISHKLKQPAAAIKGCIDTISKDYYQELDSEARETLEFIKTNNERLEKLLDDLLDISQIEKGTMQINLSDVSLSPVISEVLSNLFLDAQSKNFASGKRRFRHGG